MPIASNTPEATSRTGTTIEQPVVRLSVNLAPDVAEVLKRWTATKRISITEGIRRAIAVWNFLETERLNGNRLAVIEPHPHGDKVREIILVD